MPVKFIGAQVRAGHFTAKDTGKEIAYNNLVIFTTSEVNCGEMTEEPAKIANTVENIVKVFGRPITMEWLKSNLGKYCDIFYDKWKKVDRVIFYENNPIKDQMYDVLGVNRSAEALPVDNPVVEEGVLTEDIAGADIAGSDTAPAEEKGGRKK